MAITPNRKTPPNRNEAFRKDQHDRNAPYEDEINESRVLTERGKNATETVLPTEDGVTFEGESITELASVGREQPGDKGDPESPEADQSPYYGQGFTPSGSDKAIPRTPRHDQPRPSTGM